MIATLHPSPASRRAGGLRALRLLVLGLAFVGAASARGDMIIRVTEDPSAPGVTNSSTVIFTFTGNGQAPVLYASDFGMGTGTFGNFTIDTISATSNSGTPGSQAILTVNVTAEAVNAGHILEIDVTDDNFTFPSGGGYFLSSSASDTNDGTDASDSHTYSSFAAQGNTPFGTTFAADPITYSLGNGSNGGVTTYKGFGSSLPFSLTSYTIFNSATGNVGLLNTTGSTIAAVPEPGSVLLLGMGVGVVGLASLRRRRIAS